MVKSRSKSDTAIAILDGCYYLFILLTIVVFLLYRQDSHLRWCFLIPIVLAVGVRVASLLLKQKKGKENE